MSLTYTPQLTTEDAVAEAQGTLREAMLRYYPEEDLEDNEIGQRVHSAFEEGWLAKEFVKHSGLITHLISAELDPWSPSKRGVGRLVDADPPPRLGALHRKALDSEDARNDLGAYAEKITLAAFISQAAALDGRESPPADEVRNYWLRGLVPHYHLLLAEIPKVEDRVRAGIATPADIVLASIYFCCEAPSSEFVVRSEELGLLKGGLRRMRQRRSVAVLFLFMAAGSALFLVLQDRLPLTTAEAVTDPDLLDDYMEPRKIRDIL